MAWEDYISGIADGSIIECKLFYEHIDAEKITQLVNAISSPNCKLKLFAICDKLGEENSIKIIRALEKLHSLTSLTIADNKLGDRGAIALAEVIAINPSLIKLDIGNNNIGREGISAIANSLKNSPSLTFLALSGNEIDFEGASYLAIALAGKRLEYLSMNRNKIGSEGARVLTKALSGNNTLTYFSIDDTNIGDKMINEVLLALGSAPIQELSIGRNQLFMSKELCKLLETSTTLTALNVKENYLNSERLFAFSQALGKNSTLLELSLDENSLRDEGAGCLAKDLASNTTLGILRLRRNGIGDQGVVALAKLLGPESHLVLVDLYENAPQELGITTLKEVLLNNTTLLYLKYTSSGLSGPRVSKVQEIEEIIANNIKMFFEKVEGITTGTLLPAEVNVEELEKFKMQLAVMLKAPEIIGIDNYNREKDKFKNAQEVLETYYLAQHKHGQEHDSDSSSVISTPTFSISTTKSSTPESITQNPKTAVQKLVSKSNSTSSSLIR